MGLKIKSIQKESKASTPFWQRELSFSSLGMSDKRKRDFYSELEMLLGAGVDVNQAISIMQEEEEGKDEFLGHISAALMSGASLSSSLEEQKGFTKYEVSSIRIGEESGNLIQILGHISGYFKDRIALRKQVQGILSYPMLVLAMALSITYFMLVEVVPMFKQIYSSFDAELPLMTQRIIKASKFMEDFGILVVLILLTIVVGFFLSRKRNWFRKLTASILLRIPVLKNLVRKIYLARFCQSMRLLISSDVPLSYALGLVAEMISFHPMEVALQDVRQRLVSGESFHSSIASYPMLFEKKFVSLMRVSEDLNRFEEMFDRLAEQYQEEVKTSTTAFGKMLEPLLIILIAIFVGFILVAMYMPLFQMGDAVL